MLIRKYACIAAIAAFLTAFVATPARAALVTEVLADSSFVSTGLYIKANQKFSVTADGTVNLATGDGPYTTNADGTIVDPSPVGSGSWYYFSSFAGDNVVGGNKIVAGSGLTGYSYPTLGGANYGSLLGLFSTSDSANLVSDFSSAIALGVGGFYTSAVSGYLYLSVNDTNRSDNSGSYMVSVSAVPLPAALPLFGLGLGGLAALKRRKTKA